MTAFTAAFRTVKCPDWEAFLRGAQRERGGESRFSFLANRMTIGTPDHVVKTLLQRPIAYHRAFTQITGKVSAGLMLSQAYYWTPRANQGDGWFFKTRDEWEEETGLSRSEQESARKRLVELGLLAEELRGMPGRLHFRVNFERILALLAEIPPTGTSRRKTRQQDGRIPANKSAENPPTLLITETTTKTTSENTVPPPYKGIDFLSALRAFENSRKEMKKPITPEARRLLYKKLSRWSEEDATEALETAVMNRWQGVFEPKRNGNVQSNRQRSAESTFEFTPEHRIS